MEGLAEYLNECEFKKVGKSNAYVVMCDRGKITLFINPTSVTLMSDNQAGGMNHHITTIRRIKTVVELQRLMSREVKSFNSRLL